LRSGYSEQGLRARAAGGDELADLGGAAGDDAGEGRLDAGEADQRAQPADIGVSGVGDGLLSGEIAGLLVRFLLGDGILLQQSGPARRGGRRQRLIGLGGLQIGLRGLDLLLHLGRVDQSEQLAGLHRRADVGQPLADIAARSRVNRRAVERLHIAREHQRAAAAHRLGMDDVHGRDRLVLRPGGELALGAMAREQAPRHRQHGDDHRDQADPLQHFRISLRLRPVDGIMHGLPPGVRRMSVGPCDGRR
jgi:hypothetical protein